MAKNRKHHDDITIIDAVETLSNIADLDFDAEIGVTQSHKLVIQGKDFTYRTVHWLAGSDTDETIRAVRETFSTVLHYLQQFYRKEKKDIHDPKTFEGIKNIMFLVGEAAKKLDRYTDLFKQHQLGSIFNLSEFKELQKFYRTRIVPEDRERKALDRLFQRKVAPLTQRGVNAYARRKRDRNDPKFVFIDLDSLKKDREYELMLLRKREGQKFYHPRLLRNLKLVLDFEDTFGTSDRKADALKNLAFWTDQCYHVAARNILDSVRSELDEFYVNSYKFKDRDFVAQLNKGTMALMMSTHKKNLAKNEPAKTCHQYYQDFQVYLRQALQSRDYQRNLLYDDPKGNKIEESLMDLAHAYGQAIFTQNRGLQELLSVINLLIKHENPKQRSPKSLAQAFDQWNEAMNRVIKQHPNGPLFKVLDSLDENAATSFDSLLQDNLPNQLFDMYIGDFKSTFLRIPSPTYQHDVHKAAISPEFLAMLRGYEGGVIKKKHLMFNLQDRTAWQEHARCRALEQLPGQDHFDRALTVITLPKDTDFYHQLPPYDSVDNAKTFLEQLSEHNRSKASGFYFSDALQRSISPEWMDQACAFIYETFFDQAEELGRWERLDFIELFYLMIQLKAIEAVHPETVSHTCKDALDIGEASSALLFGFFQLVTKQDDREEALKMLQFMSYAPALLTRERLIQPDRLARTVSVFRTIENAQKKAGRVFATQFRQGMKSLFTLPFTKTLVHGRKAKK